MFTVEFRPNYYNNYQDGGWGALPGPANAPGLARDYGPYHLFVEFEDNTRHELGRFESLDQIQLAMDRYVAEVEEFHNHPLMNQDNESTD